jgi:hypothetical protein
VGTLLRGWARTNAWAWARSCEHGRGHGLGRGHVVEGMGADECMGVGTLL